MHHQFQKRLSAMLFDVDGTLMDTVPDLLDLTNRILEELDQPPQTAESIHRLMGMDPKYRLIHLALPVDASEREQAHALELWEKYFPEHQDLARPFPGIPEALQALSDEGFALGVVSNKRQDAVEDLCKRWFPGLITACVGRQPGVPIKPDPAMLVQAANDLDWPVAQIAYVGDTATDMEAAHNASMCAVAVTWGFQDPARFTGASAPDRIICASSQLPELAHVFEQ